MPTPARNKPARELPERELDVRGLSCPLPILRAKKTLGEMAGGEILSVVATDPGAVADFAAFAKETGHRLLESTAADGEFCFRLQKS